MKEDKPSGKTLSPDVQELQDLYQIMVEEGLGMLELKDEEFRVRLSRRTAATAHAHQPAPPSIQTSLAPEHVKETQEPVHDNTINAPLAGVFYRASSPTSAAFVKEGDSVETGQTLCIVEAMKVMNEIKAENRCRIVKIIAENARPVTANQPLFQVETL